MHSSVRGGPPARASLLWLPAARSRKGARLLSSEGRDPSPTPDKTSLKEKQGCERRMKSLICRCFLSDEVIILRVRVPLFASELLQLLCTGHQGRGSQGFDRSRPKDRSQNHDSRIRTRGSTDWPTRPPRTKNHREPWPLS